MTAINRGWIGVGFDGTLAKWAPGDKLGAPIPVMVERVKRWLRDGIEVRIVTGRVSKASHNPSAGAQIMVWCIEHIGQDLKVTDAMDREMVALYDCRAVQVVQDRGILISAMLATSP